MVVVEETEKTDNGLDYLIKSKESGSWLACAYTKETAQLIADALNAYDKDNEGVRVND